MLEMLLLCVLLLHEDNFLVFHRSLLSNHRVNCLKNSSHSATVFPQYAGRWYVYLEIPALFAPPGSTCGTANYQVTKKILSFEGHVSSFMKQGFYRYFLYFLFFTSFWLTLARIYKRPKIKMLVGHAFISFISFSVQVNEAEGYLEVRNTGLLPNGEYTVVHMFQTFCV